MPNVPNVCRICLEEDVPTTPATFTDKIIYDSLANACAEVGWSDEVPQGLCTVCREELQRTLKFRILCEQSAGKINNKYWLPIEEQRKQLEETAMSCPVSEASITSKNMPIYAATEAPTTSGTVPSGPWDYDFEEDDVEMSYGKRKHPQQPKASKWPCHVCDKPLKRRKIFLDHMQAVHRVFPERVNDPCLKCGFVCPDQIALKKHFESFIKCNPFKCKLCYKRFHKFFQLKDHSVSLHKVLPDMQTTWHKRA